MSQILQDVKEEKTRIFYIKRVQHVLKKLNEPLDNYTYFISNFDDVIMFLKETKNNSGVHVYCIAISKIVLYIDNTSDTIKQHNKQNYLNIANDANKIVKNKNKPKKEIANVLQDEDIENVEEIEHVPVQETRKSTRVLKQKPNTNIVNKKEENKPINITNTQSNNIQDELENILQQMEKRNITTKNYRYKIKQFIREYNPNAQNLDFFITDSTNIIHYLTNNNFHRDTIVGFYSPIVKLIYYLPFDVSDIDKAYNNYKQMLDKLSKRSEYVQRTPEYYGGYDWIKLRNKLHDIAKKEKNDETKLLVALYMDQPPRRSSDYA